MGGWTVKDFHGHNMLFKNDSQRKACFANMDKFHRDPKILKIETPMGVVLAKEDFIKEIGVSTIPRSPKKKGIVEIIKEEGGTPQTFDPTQMSLKSLDEVKSEYSAIWDEEGSYDAIDKKALKFLRKLAKSKRVDISAWANKELKDMYENAKVEREEARMEDPSKGQDPDYFRSEEDMAWLAERDSEYLD